MILIYAGLVCADVSAILVRSSAIHLVVPSMFLENVLSLVHACCCFYWDIRTPTFLLRKLTSRLVVAKYISILYILNLFLLPNLQISLQLILLLRRLLIIVEFQILEELILR